MKKHPVYRERDFKIVAPVHIYREGDFKIKTYVSFLSLIQLQLINYTIGTMVPWYHGTLHILWYVRNEI